MYKNAAQTVASGGASATKIQFDADSYDDDNITDPTVGYDITPDVTGKFLVVGTIRFQTPVDQKYYRVYCYVNNSLVARTDFEASGTNRMSCQVVTIPAVTSGQAIDIRVYHNDGTNTPIETGTNVTWFEVHQLS